MLVFLIPGWRHARADDRVARIISGDEVALTDGRVVRLAGVKGWPEAKDFLEKTAAGQTVILQDATTDRYGRVAATVVLMGHAQSLQEEMLTQGLGFVYPVVGNEARLEPMLAVEQESRRDQRGVWSAHADMTADDAEKLYGRYGFVSGVITKAERIKNRLYLNFGADWKTDFTIAIAAHDLRAFKNADIDLLSWQGKNVRVRGWVKRDFGPMITVTDPHQIELLSPPS